jgi:hypothetical protein
MCQIAVGRAIEAGGRRKMKVSAGHRENAAKNHVWLPKYSIQEVDDALEFLVANGIISPVGDGFYRFIHNKLRFSIGRVKRW